MYESAKLTEGLRLNREASRLEAIATSSKDATSRALNGQRVEISAFSPRQRYRCAGRFQGIGRDGHRRRWFDCWVISQGDGFENSVLEVDNKPTASTTNFVEWQYVEVDEFVRARVTRAEDRFGIAR
ncbi:unnamed protein product [Durusdinium trenchii]|uniref:Uncharacterized protein n=1 Tax=Durusdinium trenchii TaxID=1381693 RepID=A0ABP0KTL8_9DINO